MSEARPRCVRGVLDLQNDLSPLEISHGREERRGVRATTSARGELRGEFIAIDRQRAVPEHPLREQRGDPHRKRKWNPRRFEDGSRGQGYPVDQPALVDHVKSLGRKERAGVLVGANEAEAARARLPVEPALQLAPGAGVQVGEGLIDEQHLWPARHHRGHQRSDLLPGAQGIGQTPLESREPVRLEGLGHPGLNLTRREGQGLESERDLGLHSVGEKLGIGFLEESGDVRPECRWVPLRVDGNLEVNHATGGRTLQSGEEPDEGRFARAVWAEDEVALTHPELGAKVIEDAARIFAGDGRRYRGRRTLEPDHSSAGAPSASDARVSSPSPASAAGAYGVGARSSFSR